MATPTVHIARNQNYGCIQCGQCCRRFHVRLTEAEVTRLQALDWGAEPDVPRDFTHRLGGHTYFQRRADGGCVFLDGQTGACRMHARFGFDVKALTCRGYPHNLASTWRDEVAVVARLDCPAVQQHAGKPLEANRRQIEHLVEELGTRGSFTVRQLEGLNRETVKRLTRVLVGLIEEHGKRSPGALAYTLFLAAERWQALGASFLNDSETLEAVLPSLLAGVRDEAAARPAERLGLLSKALFREWLAACCRRDEELVRPGLAIRLHRSAALAAYALGVGSLRAMGQEHPDLSLRRVRLFAAGEGWEPSSPDAWEAFWRLLVARLEGPQFFGVAYYDQPFFTGLRALLQSYALVLAAARTHAAARLASGAGGGGPPHLHWLWSARGIPGTGREPRPVHSSGEAPGLRRSGGGPPHLHQTAGEPTASPPNHGGGPPHLHHTAVEPTASPPNHGGGPPHLHQTAGEPTASPPNHGGGPPHLHQTAVGARRIETEDVHYAVGAIDHTLGRSPLLQWQLWRQVEGYFGGARYGRLLHSLGWE